MTVTLAPKTHTMYDQGNGTYKTSEPVFGDIQGAQLAAGHFVVQQNSMVVVLPRADGVTQAHSRHKWMYYDGVNDIQYEVPIKIYGGSPPFRYQIITAPAELTVEAIWGNPNRDGIIKCTPTQAYTNEPVSIRVYGQDGNTIDISYTFSTASTSRFIFLAGTGNDTTGAGTIASPWRSLAKVFGASRFTETYPGKIVYLMNGDYTMAAHSDGGNRVRLRDDFQPVVYITYPGHTANIDMAPAEFFFDGQDNWWSGSTTGRLIFDGQCTVTAEAHNVWVGTTSKNTVFAWVDWDSFVPRVAGDFTNSVPIFLHESNTSPDRQYVSLHDVQETNRTVRIQNDGYIFLAFGTEYLVNDYCGNGTEGGFNFKDTCYHTSTRYANLNSDYHPFAIAFMCQNGSGNNEVCYSKIRGRLFYNFQDNASTAGKITSFRNTIWTDDTEYAEGIYARDSANKDYDSINDVVVSVGPANIHSLITVTGSITADAAASDMPINNTTMVLQNSTTAWRTENLGLKGAEIQ